MIGLMNMNNKSKVYFFSAPYWDYYSPFSALPCLAGHLKKQGFETHIIDLNIQFFKKVIREKLFLSIKKLSDSKSYERIDQSYKRAFSADNSDVFCENAKFITQEYTLIEGIKNNYKNLGYKELNLLDGLYHYTFFQDVYGINAYELVQKIDLAELYQPYHIEEILYVLQENLNNITLENNCIVAFSATSMEQFIVSYYCAKWIRANYPNQKIIFGGSYANHIIRNVEKKYIQKLFSVFHYISYSEGETSLTKLLLYIDGQEQNLSEVPGIAWMDETKNIRITDPYSEELSSLEVPDYSDICFEDYLLPVPMISYQTSRGCFWGNCAFCDHEESYRRMYRQKPVEKVIRDLKELRIKYNITHFQFVDEAIEPDYLYELTNSMKKEQELCDINWMFYSRISRKYSEKLVNQLYDCGCRLTLFGVESFNERILKLIKKGIRVEYIKDNLKWFHDSKIGTIIWLIAGFPTQTPEELREEIREMKNYAPYLDGIFAGLFRLELNCDIYREKDKFGIIDFDEKDRYKFTSVKDGMIIDQKEIHNIYNKEYVNIVDEISSSHNRYIIYLKNL